MTGKCVLVILPPEELTQFWGGQPVPAVYICPTKEWATSIAGLLGVVKDASHRGAPAPVNFVSVEAYILQTDAQTPVDLVLWLDASQAEDVDWGEMTIVSSLDGAEVTDG